MARRAGTCANPIAPEQRAHNERANSSQLPQRPDSEFNMKSNLELSLEASNLLYWSVEFTLLGEGSWNNLVSTPLALV